MNDPTPAFEALHSVGADRQRRVKIRLNPNTDCPAGQRFVILDSASGHISGAFSTLKSAENMAKRMGWAVDE